MLEARGAVVIEADRVGHEVLEVGHPVAAAVAARWPDVVGDDGAIDRSRLAAIVFNDAEALRELESHTHPAISEEVLRRAEAVGDAPVVVELPLVATWFGQDWWWIAVTADPDVRLQRAEGRGGSRGDVERRMASQPSQDDYMAAADFVIVNDGGLADLAERVNDVWETLSRA